MSLLGTCIAKLLECCTYYMISLFGPTHVCCRMQCNETNICPFPLYFTTNVASDGTQNHQTARPTPHSLSPNTHYVGRQVKKKCMHIFLTCCSTLPANTDLSVCSTVTLNLLCLLTFALLYKPLSLYG